MKVGSAFVVPPSATPPFGSGRCCAWDCSKLGWIVLDTVSESIQPNLTQSHAQHHPEPKLENS